MDDGWNEDDSALYRRLVDVAVPRRAEQIATLLTLLPLDARSESEVVELGCGLGALAHAVLEAYPRSRLTALDGSQSMCAHAADRLGDFGDRVTVASFQLSETDWLEHVEGADAVVSSLCLHHLDGVDKKRLFVEIAERLSPGGALLIADLVAPVRSEAEALFRESWDRCARAADSASWPLFESERWNVYRYPDPADKPSPLFEQLSWLGEAGFAAVDAFWISAGHAIYGGYGPAARTGPVLDYERAIAIARRAIEATR